MPCIQSVLTFPFAKCTVTDVVYLDMYDEFLLPIFIEEDPNGMQLQQDGAVPNFNIAVRSGRTAQNRSAKAAVSLHRLSADLKPVDSFL